LSGFDGRLWAPIDNEVMHGTFVVSRQDRSGGSWDVTDRVILANEGLDESTSSNHMAVRNSTSPSTSSRVRSMCRKPGIRIASIPGITSPRTTRFVGLRVLACSPTAPDPADHRGTPGSGFESRRRLTSAGSPPGARACSSSEECTSREQIVTFRCGLLPSAHPRPRRWSRPRGSTLRPGSADSGGPSVGDARQPTTTCAILRSGRGGCLSLRTVALKRWNRFVHFVAASYERQFSIALASQLAGTHHQF
jgi:hypothetical protein